MRSLILLASFALAAPAAAQDQPPPEKPLHYFPGLPEPAPAERQAGFQTRGQLFVAPSGEPFRALPGTPYPSITWFTQADTDHDGKLDRTEFENDFARFFAVLDTNHDQVIDPAEIQVYETRIVPEVRTGGVEGFGGERPSGGRSGGRRNRGGGGRPGGNAGGGEGSFAGGFGGGHGGAPAAAPAGLSGEGAGGNGSGLQDGDAPSGRPAPLPIEGAGRFGMISNPEPVSSMDINLDGSVSLAEMRAAARRRFDLLDRDGRGYLTFRSLPEPPAQRGRR